MANSLNGFGLRVLTVISRLLKSLWLFFPGILFLILFVFCFWLLGQGKDIIVAFTENQSHTTFLQINYTRIIFFIAIGFWVYVSWYSSRIISYIKKSKQVDSIRGVAGVDQSKAEEIYEHEKTPNVLGVKFLNEFPRMIGNACVLIIELATLQSPVRYHPLSQLAALIIFIISIIGLRYLNKWITKSQSVKPSFRKIFVVLLMLLIACIVAVSLLPGRINILFLFALLLLFHLVFLFYIHLRRVVMEQDAGTIKAKSEIERTQGKNRNLLVRLMDFLCVPRKEKGYFKWFLIISFFGIAFYIIAINWLYFARGIGPFPFIILAFGVLLAFGNTVTAFSVRFNVNFHFLLFALALLVGLGETHYVRTFTPKGNDNNYANRPELKTYLSAWLNDRNVSADTSASGYDIYFIMANGGASRSGYWTAAVLGKIEDSSIKYNSLDRFSDHVFCLSGTSGGGVGVASFFGLLRNREQKTQPIYSVSARQFLKMDYFTYTAARMLGPDFFNYILHFSTSKDRAAALEESFEESSLDTPDTLYGVPFSDTLSAFPAMQSNKVFLPILCINTTRMQDGNPGVVTNLRLDSNTFNNRVDVLKLLKPDEDITLASGAILGARFPYLSPAGRIANNYFVDGGYFDNSGAGVVQEMIRGILNIAKEDSLHHGNLYQQIKKLHFKILHITNSPVNLDSSNIKPVAPFKNDLLAPVLTIVGAYDMQTTVNDGRLINYIKDINAYSTNKADYIQIPLYKDSTEWNEGDPLYKRFKGKEPSYAMNWFMSDTTLHRIDKRLQESGKLHSLIASMRSRKDSVK